MTLTPAHRHALSGALVALAGPAEPQERARLLAETAHAAFATGAEAVVLAEPPDPPEGLTPAAEADQDVAAVAGSDDGCRRLADLERATRDGPALACARTGRLIELALGEEISNRAGGSGRTGEAGGGGEAAGAGEAGGAGREFDRESDREGDREVGGDPAEGFAWAEWGALAAELGWRRASAVPLTAGGAAVGGLVLLSPPGHRPSVADLGWASTLGAVAAAGLLQQRALHRQYARTDQLQRALESRIVIEQAKGVLAERGGIDPSTAFDRLRRYARGRRRRLHDVAGDVVQGGLSDAVLACTSDCSPTSGD